MKEGAWINARSGFACWITEHASWLKVPAQARRLGLSEEAIGRIRTIPWDFNGPGRRAILLAAMDEGLIRFRGHGAFVTFEFTLPWDEALQATGPFMAAQFGPATQVRMTNLTTGERKEGSYATWGALTGRDASVQPPGRS